MAVKSKEKWKKTFRSLRFNIAVFLILTMIGIIAYFFLRGILLQNTQKLGTSLTENCAVEERNNLTVYETLLAFGADALRSEMEDGAQGEELEHWLQNYYQMLQERLGANTVDPYALVHGKIIAATPWVNDPTYNYAASNWYQQAMKAEGEVIFTDIYTDAIYNRGVITVAQKLEGQDAIMAFDIFPENFELSLDELPRNGSLFLCDSQGRIIYKQMTTAYPAEDIQLYVSEILKEIDDQEHARYDSSVLDMEGERRGVYYTDMPNGWRIIITIPFASILGDLQRLMWASIALLFIVIWIFGLMIWRELRINEQMERTSETVRVLGNSYFALYRVDYGKNTYEMIKGSDYMRNRIAPKGQYTDLLEVLGEVIEPEAYDEYVDSFSLSNIRRLVSQRIRDFGGSFLRRLGDTYRWVDVRVLFDESLAPEEVVLCFREADEEKKQMLQEHRLLEDSLKISRESEKSKQMFFSSMSHDMRTPLNAIIGMSGLAARSVEDPVKTADYIEKIERSGRQLLQLINEILDMSYAEQGKIVLNNQQMDLKKCVEECAAPFVFQADKEKKRFSVSFALEDAQVMGDPFRLNQILNNLLSNAFKFTGYGDRISLLVKQVKKQAYSEYTIVVSDTGIGMSEEFLPKVFDPYAREARFGSQPVIGTGLGMAIVKNLVEQMDGHIQVESRQGEGSTFTVSLPLMAVEDTSAASAEEVQPSEPFSLEGRCILLAEDNSINMEVASEILAMNGVQVIKAWDGQEAVELFENSAPFSFDAVLLDMQMPKMDGCEAARRIRRLRRPDAAVVPILAVTANAFTEDITATAKAGMDAHISKPIDFRILCDTLASLIHKRKDISASERS